jgi:hypothetical protein
VACLQELKAFGDSEPYKLPEGSFLLSLEQLGAPNHSSPVPLSHLLVHIGEGNLRIERLCSIFQTAPVCDLLNSINAAPNY